MKDFFESSIRSFYITKSILFHCTSNSTFPYWFLVAILKVGKHDDGSITYTHALSLRKLYELSNGMANFDCTHLTIDSLNNMVRIEVGASLDKDESKVFADPSGLLTQHSISVKDRLSNGPIYVHVLSLPNYNPNTVELYIHLV